MKNVHHLLLCCFLAIANLSAAQDDTVHAFDAVDVKPEFKGGMKAFYAYFAGHFKMPEDAVAKERLIVSFIVERNGTLSDAKVIREPGSGIGEEALRVLKLSPKWKPGQKNGKRVRTAYTLPIPLDKLKPKSKK